MVLDPPWRNVRHHYGAHRAGFRGFELLGAQLAGQRLETDRTADANYLDELPFFGRCAWFVCRARVNGRYRRRRNSTRLIKMRTQLGGSADVFESLPERVRRARRRPLSKNSSWCVCAERTFGQAQSGSWCATKVIANSARVVVCLGQSTNQSFLWHPDDDLRGVRCRGKRKKSVAGKPDVAEIDW